MELHTCLWNEVDAFNFERADFSPLLEAIPELQLHCHETEQSFLANAENAQFVLTWDFYADWYAKCPNLKLVLTPAAGTDWVEPDPSGRVPVEHGSFHGQIMVESLIQALLFMNHKMPLMLQNFEHRNWDRNLQTNSRLLSQQTVLLIGLGNIGSYCAETIIQLGANVIGIRRQPESSATQPFPVYPVSELQNHLPQADHVVLLLPGNAATDGFMSGELLKACKPGAMLYNFGRGNALRSVDLIEHWQHLGGAFLDVTDEEPLPADSPLWQLENIMITPHSSCIYADYRSLFIAEVIEKLQGRLG